jgi:hypothetical protein
MAVPRPAKRNLPRCFALNSVRCIEHWTNFNMAMDPKDYYVITFRRGEHPERWSWELHRKSKPLGVKMTTDGFQSEMAAQFAGKRALADFLNALSQEESRARK